MAKTIKVDGYEIEDIDIWTLNGKIVHLAKPLSAWDPVAQKKVPDARFIKVKNSVQNMVLCPKSISGGTIHERYVLCRNEMTGEDVSVRHEDFLYCLEKLGIQNNRITGTFAYRRYYGVYATPLFRD